MTRRRLLFHSDANPGYVPHAVRGWEDPVAPPAMPWVAFRLRRQREVTLPPADMQQAYVGVPPVDRSNVGGRIRYESLTMWATFTLLDVLE